MEQMLLREIRSCKRMLSRRDELVFKNCVVKLVPYSKKTQRRQYGFGNNSNSDEFVLKKLSNELLSDGSVTTTKSIDNFFGNLYRELQKIGSIGLNKGTNDFNMKYSNNLIQPKVFL